MNPIGIFRLRYVLVIQCVLLFNLANAQYVNIPDQGFLGWIYTNLNTCLDVHMQLDTTCPELLNETTITCEFNHIASLEGIQYFKNLQYLDCSYNIVDSILVLPQSLTYLDCNSNDSISFISVLPPKLKFFNCGGNRLTTLPKLPDSLTILLCGGNMLSTLPSLPTNLDSLDCGGNMLTALPLLPTSLHGLFCAQNLLTTLPSGVSLKYLYCYYNNIILLPAYPNLQLLDCAYNSLSRLPLLPASLTDLDCSYNNIDSIFDLPNNILYLSCGINQLKSLGQHLPDSLIGFSCDINQLTTLPLLPHHLINLGCSSNILTSLPELPDSMGELNCMNNPYLICMPELKKIGYFIFDSTGITCLPNYGHVTTSIPSLDSIPLCITGNPNGCPIYSGINEISNIANTLSIYPNPANATCNLQTSGSGKMCSAIITDALGREVRSLFNNQQLSSYQFSCNTLKSGIYFITVKDEQENIAVLKMVKQ